MIELSPRLAALLVGVPTTAALLYWLFRTLTDEDEEVNSSRTNVSYHQTVIEVKVPEKAVGAIIGRQGSNIKEIQSKSGARVDFQDRSLLKEGEERTVIIKGKLESVQMAETLIRQNIIDIPVVVVETIVVPSNAIGRIIGKGGDTVKNISRLSKAKVYIDRTREDYRNIDRPIQITGTKEQIEIAKGMIVEKVQEEEVFRAKQAVMEANRERRQNLAKASKLTENSKSAEEPRTPDPLNILPSPLASHSTNTLSTAVCVPPLPLGNVFTWPTGPDYVEVYVSSVANPSTFWVQVLSSNSVKLDQLVNEMTMLYSNDNEVMPVTVKIGDIVAAPFDMDSSWYRARVMGLEEDKIDLFYLDYGDSCFIDKAKLKPLRSEFYEFPFQAIECQLADIAPKGSDWSEESIDRFEDLTYCAKWKVLMAKHLSASTSINGDQIHKVILIDTNTQRDVNIGNELVLQGYAQWREEES